MIKILVRIFFKPYLPPILMVDTLLYLQRLGCQLVWQRFPKCDLTRLELSYHTQYDLDGL